MKQCIDIAHQFDGLCLSLHKNFLKSQNMKVPGGQNVFSHMLWFSNYIHSFFLCFRFTEFQLRKYFINLSPVLGIIYLEIFTLSENYPPLLGLP